MPTQHVHQDRCPARAPLATAIGIALASLALSAARADTGENPGSEPEEVRVYGEYRERHLEDRMSSPQYTADLLDTARTINIINADVIREQAADSLAQILTNVPGISMQAGEGGAPAGDQLSIRGFSARTDIFVDGVRDFGGYTRDSFLLDRVEVAKGPGSNYTGRGSTGGSINLVSKTAEDENFVLATAALGNADFRRATLDANHSFGGTTALRVNLMAHDAAVADRNEVEDSRWGAAPTVTFGLGTATRTILGWSHMEQDNVPDYGIPWVPANNTALPEYASGLPPVDDANWYGMSERDYEDITNDLVTARVEHDFSDGMLLTSQLRWGDTVRDSVITAPRFASTDGTDIRRTDWKSRDQQDRILNNLTALSMEFTTGSWSHSLATGVELSDEYEVNHARVITGEQPNTDLFHPTPHDHWGGSVLRTGAKTESDGFSTGVFLADSIAFDEHWLVTAGLRWDRFALDYDETAADGTRTRYERTDSDTSWQASVVYKPVPNGSIYAGYGTSFNPSGEGLTLVLRGGSLAQLDPEESRSFELGTKWELYDEQLLLNAALFRTDKTNARETDPVDSTLNVLAGEQRVSGVELGAVGRLTQAWSVIAGYTWMDSEITGSIVPGLEGNELSNTPENTWSLWTTWAPTESLLFGVGGQYVDERYSSSANDRVAPDYHVFNAMASWSLSARVAFRFNATNLADDDYVANVGGGHWIPGEGRSYSVSIDYRL